MADTSHVEISPNRDVCLHVMAKSSHSKIQLSLKSSKTKKTIVEERKQVLAGQSVGNFELMKRELETKDWLLLQITADRDKVKSKLAETLNKNVELELKLNKYRSMLKKSHHVCADKSTVTTSHPPVFIDLELLKTRCQEFESINVHLSEHLTKLRTAFNELNLSGSGASGSASKSTQIRTSTLKESIETESAELTVTISDQSSKFDNWYHS